MAFFAPSFWACSQPKAKLRKIAILDEILDFGANFVDKWSKMAVGNKKSGQKSHLAKYPKKKSRKFFFNWEWTAPCCCNRHISNWKLKINGIFYQILEKWLKLILKVLTMIDFEGFDKKNIKIWSTKFQILNLLISIFE